MATVTTQYPGNLALQHEVWTLTLAEARLRRERRSMQSTAHQRGSSLQAENTPYMKEKEMETPAYRPGTLLRIIQRFQAATGHPAELAQTGDMLRLTSGAAGGLCWMFTVDELPELVSRSQQWTLGMTLDAMV